MTARTDERAAFLSDVLVTAVEHRGYGFPGVLSYAVEPGGDPRRTVAVIYDRYEDPNATGEKWTVDLATIARGFKMVRAMNPNTHADWVRDLQRADRDNYAADIDVNGALLVLECALFGKGVYV